MNTRWARVARGTLAACFAVFVAALFHAAMGGGVPSVLAITLSLAFAVPACVLLTQGRTRRMPKGPAAHTSRRGLLRQALAVSLSQFALHALFSLQPGGARFSGAEFSTADGSAHLHAGSHLAMTGEASAGQMTGMHETPLMWLGHASAVVLTVVAMRYGERTLRALLATAAIGVIGIMAIVERIALVPVRATAAMLRAVDARPVILPAPRVLIGKMRHRGPPVGAFNHA